MLGIGDTIEVLLIRGRNMIIPTDCKELLTGSGTMLRSRKTVRFLVMLVLEQLRRSVSRIEMIDKVVCIGTNPICVRQAGAKKKKNLQSLCHCLSAGKLYCPQY